MSRRAPSRLHADRDDGGPPDHRHRDHAGRAADRGRLRLARGAARGAADRRHHGPLPRARRWRGRRRRSWSSTPTATASPRPTGAAGRCSPIARSSSASRAAPTSATARVQILFFPNGSTSGADVVVASRRDRTRNRLRIRLDPLIGRGRRGGRRVMTRAVARARLHAARDRRRARHPRHRHGGLPADLQRQPAAAGPRVAPEPRGAGTRAPAWTRCSSSRPKSARRLRGRTAAEGFRTRVAASAHAGAGGRRRAGRRASTSRRAACATSRSTWPGRTASGAKTYTLQEHAGGAPRRR